MENASPLPEGYSELLKIDLQKDRKSALLVNGLALLIALPMVAVGAVMAPFSTLLDSSAGWLAYAGRWGVLQKQGPEKASDPCFWYFRIILRRVSGHAP